MHGAQEAADNFFPLAILRPAERDSETCGNPLSAVDYSASPPVPATLSASML